MTKVSKEIAEAVARFSKADRKRSRAKQKLYDLMTEVKVAEDRHRELDLKAANARRKLIEAIVPPAK